MFYLLPVLLIALWLVVPATLAALLPKAPLLSRSAVASVLGIAAWLVLAARLQPISFAFALRWTPALAPPLAAAAAVYAALFAGGLGRRPADARAYGFGSRLIEGAVLAPIDEELLFRGIVLGWLARQLPLAAAIALAALLFLAVHELARIASPKRTLRQALADLSFGVLAGLLYASFGSILLPIALHMAVNGLALWTAPAERYRPR